MHSDTSSTPPIGATGEQSAPSESHYQDAVHALRQLEAKPVFAVVEDATLGGRPAMMALGLLVIDTAEDDVVDVMVGNGVLVSIWREPPLHALFASDWFTLESAGIRLTLLSGEPRGPGSFQEVLDDVHNRVHGVPTRYSRHRQGGDPVARAPAAREPERP